MRTLYSISRGGGIKKKAVENNLITTETIMNKCILCVSNIRLSMLLVLDLMKYMHENMISECRYMLDLISKIFFLWQEGDTIIWTVKYQRILHRRLDIQYDKNIARWPSHTIVLWAIARGPTGVIILEVSLNIIVKYMGWNLMGSDENFQSWHLACVLNQKQIPWQSSKFLYIKPLTGIVYI